MNAPNELIEPLFERIEAYSKTSLELTKLKAIKHTINTSSTLFAKLSVAILIALFIIVFNVGIALLLGEYLGKSYYGFFIVSTFYLIAGIISRFFLEQWIKKQMSNFLLSSLLN